MIAALQLFAHTGDGVFAIDRNQCIIYWNKTAAQMMGYSAGEAVGQHCWELLQGKSIAGVGICHPDCPILQKIRQQHPVAPFDLVVNHRNGQILRLNVSSFGLPNNSDGITGLVHIFRKID